MPIKSTTRALRTLLPEGDPPEEFRIFRFGVNGTLQGPVLFDAASAVLVMEAYQSHGTDLHLDYEHQVVVYPPVESPAAGWFRIEVRGDGSNPEQDGLWAFDVRWTEKAAAYIRAREYRLFSPYISLDDSGRVLALINIALTNTPAMHDLTPLMAASQLAAKDKPMKELLKALGVAEDATEADALTALTALSAREAGPNELLTLTTKATQAEALAVVQAWKAGAEQATALSQEIATLRADAEKRERDALILSLKNDKKITPAMEGWASKQSIEALKAYGEVAPTIAALSAAPAKEPQPESTKKYSEMDGREKAALYLSNRSLYEALKAAEQ